MTMTTDLVKPRAMAALASMMGPWSSGPARPMWATYGKLPFLGAGKLLLFYKSSTVLASHRSYDAAHTDFVC